jgi:hypothetical protein
MPIQFMVCTSLFLEHVCKLWLEIRRRPRTKYQAERNATNTSVAQYMHTSLCAPLRLLAQVPVDSDSTTATSSRPVTIATHRVSSTPSGSRCALAACLFSQFLCIRSCFSAIMPCKCTINSPRSESNTPFCPRSK